MVRVAILRTLLYKEYLRYRYNWGLLIVVAALLALSALVSIGSRARKLGALGADDLQSCEIRYHEGTREHAWCEFLRRQPPPEGCTVSFRGYKRAVIAPQALAPEAMAIELVGPAGGGSASGETWTARYWFPGPPQSGSVAVRDWFVRASNEFLDTRPRLREESLETANLSGINTAERVPLIVTALVIFALYLLSFNLYVTSTGEEREKRILLGLLLTPASPVEIVAAKAIFYAAASLVVALAVVGMYQPHLLLNPFLWGAVVCASVAYVAIGTVVISVVRRQTTINTISMLYLIATSIIMILAQFMPLFTVIQLLLVENYLHGLMKLIIAGEPPSRLMLGYLIMLGGGTLCWSVVAVAVFARQGMAISRAR